MTTKKKWAQPPWTPERRERHRAGCKRAAEKWEQSEKEYEKILNYLSKIKEKYGIDPSEILMFVYLLPNDQFLTEDHVLQWRAMAIKKIPATDIYQQMFGAAA